MGEGVVSKIIAKPGNIPLSLSRNTNPLPDWALKTLSPSRERGCAVPPPTAKTGLFRLGETSKETL